MDTLETKSDFVCLRCGACCRESGYVHLTDEDIDALAKFLEMDVRSFTERYTRLTHHRQGLSLTEQDNGACIFLEEGGDCHVEAAKPEQCRQFPFTWRYADMQHICKGWSINEKEKP